MLVVRTWADRTVHNNTHSLICICSLHQWASDYFKPLYKQLDRFKPRKYRIQMIFKWYFSVSANKKSILSTISIFSDNRTYILFGVEEWKIELSQFGDSIWRASFLREELGKYKVCQVCKCNQDDVGYNSN